MPGLFHASEEDTAQHGCVNSVILIFISLWKLKFLAYLLNATQRFVMRVLSYANVYFAVGNCNGRSLPKFLISVGTVKMLVLDAYYREMRI